MSTKKPKTTTPFDYEYEVWEFDPDSIPIEIRESSVVDVFMSVFGVILSIFHLFFLSRKNLRKDFIFLTILIISICNLTHFLGTFLWNFLEWDILYQINFEFCGELTTIRSRIHQIIRIWIIAIQSVSRDSSSSLMILIGVLKIFEVKVRVLIGIFANIFILGVCMSWHIYCHLQYTFYEVEYDNCNKRSKIVYINYEPSIKPKVFKSQKHVNDCVICVLLILLSVSTVILFFKLRKVVKTKNGEDDHMLLVFLLSVSFLLSELLEGSVLLFENFILKPYYNIQTYFIRYQIIVRTIITIICLGQCFICYLTSSEYQETVKKCFAWKKKSKTPAPDPATISTIRDSNTSRIPSRI